TTVSAGYAQELEAGELGPVLRARATPLAGVLDGLDYAVYNPATDSALEARYDAEDPSNKARSKTALLRALELELDVERPLLVVLLNKDGADSKLVLSSITRLLDQDLSVVAAGAGAQSDAVRAALSAMRSEHPGDFGVVERSDEPELRRLMAAADFVLTVRRGVPCAYEELCAQRYGAVPIAHASGGVTDVVVDIDAELETGTGLCFTDLTESALVGVVERALSAYGHPQFSALRRRLLRKDLGWDRAARRYLQIYRQARGENALG
ncbi:MAG: glycogen synthase GlgA, partial [Myxococcota bacterium]|nr:glycogen synthase GlgA [Myxococcota bacterium]